MQSVLLQILTSVPQALGNAFPEGPNAALLPRVLGNGAVHNDLLFVRLLQELFQLGIVMLSIAAGCLNHQVDWGLQTYI